MSTAPSWRSRKRGRPSARTAPVTELPLPELNWDSMCSKPFVDYNDHLDDLVSYIAEQQPPSHRVEAANAELEAAERALSEAKRVVDAAVQNDHCENKARILECLPAKMFSHCTDLEVQNGLLKHAKVELESQVAAQRVELSQLKSATAAQAEELSTLRCKMAQVEKLLQCPVSHEPLYTASSYILNDSVLDASAVITMTPPEFKRWVETNENPGIYVYNKEPLTKWREAGGQDPLTRGDYVYRSLIMQPCRVFLIRDLCNVVFGPRQTTGAVVVDLESNDQNAVAVNLESNDQNADGSNEQTHSDPNAAGSNQVGVHVESNDENAAGSSEQTHSGSPQPMSPAWQPQTPIHDGADNESDESETLTPMR